MTTGQTRTLASGHQPYGGQALDISLAKRVGLLLAELIKQDLKQFGKEDRVAAGYQIADGKNGALSYGQALTLELGDEEREYLSM